MKEREEVKYSRDMREREAAHVLSHVHHVCLQQIHIHSFLKTLLMFDLTHLVYFFYRFGVVGQGDFRSKNFLPWKKITVTYCLTEREHFTVYFDIFGFLKET